MGGDRWNILDLIGRSFHRFDARIVGAELRPSPCWPAWLMSSSAAAGSLHKELLELLRDCQRGGGSSREFLEAGLECLCVLAAAGFETRQRAGRCLTSIPAALAAKQRHRDSFVVQKCGLILLQLLPKEFAVSSAADNQQQHHHERMVGALRAFPNALGVQAEGCVAALLLCRAIAAIRTLPSGERRVRLSVSHCTNQLEEARPCSGWLPSALLELVLSRGQKDAALLRAIRNGNSKLARCLLELVLNPNAVSAEDSSSLICLALASFQSPSDLLDTVYCLPGRRGAVNTQSAFWRRVLTLGTDMVTGLLLKHLGYYKQGSFGSITWCNLKLQSFQARWLDPVIKPRTPEQELTEVRIRKASRLNCGIVGGPPRGAPAAGAGAGSAGAVIGLDDILPERYRLATVDFGVQPGKDEPARADSLGEVRGDGDKQQQSRQKQPPPRNASAKSNSRDRRRTLAPEVLASQIEQFRKRSDTIRSDPDAAVAGVAAAASTSEPVEGELQEFYQSTLSSSNLPYSQLDPRLRLPHPSSDRGIDSGSSSLLPATTGGSAWQLPAQRTLAAAAVATTSDSVVKVRRHRRLLLDPRRPRGGAAAAGEHSCPHRRFKPSARPEQLRLIDLSANCIRTWTRWPVSLPTLTFKCH
uniref:BTB domain-containing protein n=1 Tax=Macrostomum lignano TaxID=282301 RepID=A0A1I8FLG0_9PLAT